MLALVGPLVGVCFIDGVRSFAEVSAGAGTGCGLACDPLIGVWGPTFSAFEITAIFLLPFVAIRLVSGDRLSGASKLELQRPLSPLVRMGSKLAVLMAGWMIALSAALVPMLLWLSYGGHIRPAELAVVAVGHTLNAGLTISLGIALATMTEHPSTAAIAALAFTIGTWIVQFAAAVHGGFWSRLAQVTPSALVSTFQHGLVRIDLVLIALAFIGGGLATGAVWLRLGTRTRVRVFDVLGIAATTAVVIFACIFVHGSWDASESRLNSFPEAQEEALGRLPAPLAIDARFAPQDPRRLELERGPFAKLRRAVPNVTISYSARTAIGLFEEADPGYGDVHYRIGARTVTSRALTQEGVVESVFEAAAMEAPEEENGVYHGHPLVAQPTGAAIVLYAIWPAAIAGFSFLRVRRPT
jgi:hypothetical protein